MFSCKLLGISGRMGPDETVPATTYTFTASVAPRATRTFDVKAHEGGNVAIVICDGYVEYTALREAIDFVRDNERFGTEKRIPIGDFGE